MSNHINAMWTVAYPESMSPDWEAQLDIFPFCYCLHDKDVDADGVIKKAHVHIVFQGRLTPKQCAFVRSVLGVADNWVIQPVYSWAGVMDYLTHENEKDKYHYSRDDIYYGSCWCAEFVPEIPRKRDLDMEIIECIIQNDIFEIYDLSRLYIDDDEMKAYMRKNAYFVQSLLMSKRKHI